MAKRREHRVAEEKVQEQIQRSREVLGEATREVTPGRVGISMDRFVQQRMAGQGARPGDGSITAGRDRFVEERTRRGGARPT